MKQGSLFGGILLIGGCCLGAGMLALPILTGLSGFFPSLSMFLLAWVFMTVTGLLMVEANSWFKEQVNIVSMAGHALGFFGRALSWVLYLFLFYSLLVAYISASGGLVSTYSQTYFSFNLPVWAGSLFFVILFASVVYRGTHTVDHWNRILMVGKILTYLFMVMVGVEYVKPHLLARTEPSYAIFSLPVLIISFGYHNMIPTLMGYMKGDVKRVRLTILGGSVFALVIYLIWEIVVLGIVPPEGEWGLISSWKHGRQASDAIAGIVGVSWLTTFAEGLAFFALLTSFLAQTLALVHFLADGLKVKSENKENIGLCILALAPPLIFSLIYPQFFIKAINFAGGICAVILFGLLPACMVWIGRYTKKNPATYSVIGGKPLLIAVMLFALFILFFQISNMSGASFIPKP
jgi:tyrosine-specific transport protein